MTEHPGSGEWETGYSPDLLRAHDNQHLPDTRVRDREFGRREKGVSQTVIGHQLCVKDM